jgi:hypothetical protein
MTTRPLVLKIFSNYGRINAGELQSWEKWWGVPQAIWISLCVPGLFQVNTHTIRHVNWHDNWGMHKQHKYCDIIEWFVLKFCWILLKNVNFECLQSKYSWRITECSASVLALLAGFLNSGCWISAGRIDNW